MSETSKQALAGSLGVLICGAMLIEKRGFRGNVECDLHCERKSCGMDGIYVIF